ncbi:ubiquitin-conjugating enzyme E2 J1-like isoform X2 [Oratosquilla oratoria]|uniref:ubiquitin-conjugating enzyme E2 J1-like isoform X2 n=1 Tax=Oratosquilla oratoria TaxID=337810 RepID=UPI003F7695C2
MENSYNARCPAVKRLLREAQEFHESTEEYSAQPLEENLFEWHFTLRGPSDSEFDGGIYHGRILMPSEYPMKPPNIIFLTPNGRFEANKKICLSISGHHPETWQPSWSIRTALLALIGFMPTPASGTIGSLEYTAAERARLAVKSREYICPECGPVHKLLKERTGSNEAVQREAQQAMSQMAVTIKNEDKSSAPVSGVADLEQLSCKDKDQGNLVVDSKDESDYTVQKENTSSSQSTEPIEKILNTDPSVRDSNSTEVVQNDVDGPGEGQALQQQQHTPPHIPIQNVQETRAASPVVAHSSVDYLYSVILSASVAVFLALLFRRIFLLESGNIDEYDGVML